MKGRIVRVVVPVLTRLLSALSALVLLAAGSLIVIEVVANWTGNGFVVLPEDWPDQLRATSWDATIVRNSLLITLATGMVLLMVSLWRRPPLTVESSQDGIRIERHALESSLRRRLESLDGVSSSRVRVDRNRIRATVDTPRRLAPESVRDAAMAELTGFCALHDLTFDADVTLNAPGVAR